MSQPNCPQKSPYVLEVEAGKTYWWCSCGDSKNQPFCDGAHKGTDFRPVECTFEEVKKVAWCGCKQSAKGAFCDGKHKEL